MTERETMTDRANPPDPSLPAPSIGGESVGDPTVPRPVPGAGPDQIVSSDPTAMAGGLVEGPPVAGVDAGKGSGRLGDRVFAGLANGASGLIVLIVVLIAAFLFKASIPSIAHDKDNFLTSTRFIATPGDLHFGIAALLYVTVIISVVAMVIAVPVSIGVALFMTHYAPKQLRKPVAYVIDLLAAIPSIVYGIWGAYVLAPKLLPIADGLSHIPIPLFDKGNGPRSIFAGGVVLAVMILPIMTAISRDVFERTPRQNIEAALALGATKWEMIRMTVIPYGRAGVVSGAMLGLGRALGETIAVLLIVATVSPPFKPTIFTGGSTFASLIAAASSEFNNPESTGAYIAAGLVLFVLTFIVNAAARAIVNRKKDFVS